MIPVTLGAAAGFAAVLLALVWPLARLVRARRQSRWLGLPLPRAVLSRHPTARTLHPSLSGGEPVIALPGREEGLSLNAVAARCWELTDGSRSLVEIARIIASEYAVSSEEALREVRGFARRLKSALLALEAREWALAHTHALDLFSGRLRAEQESGLTEIRLGDKLWLHAPAFMIAPGGEVEPWRGGWLQRLKARRSMAVHLRDEEPLESLAREFQAGWDYCAAGRLQEALTAFQGCVAAAPDWANAHYQLGYIRMRRQEYPQARTSLERAETLQPGTYMVREYLEMAERLQAGDLSHEAFIFFERATASGLGDPDAAVRLARRALDISPRFPAARLVLARALQRKDRPDLALEELSRAIRDNPDKATLCQALYSRGVLFMALGKRNDALREWETVVAIDGSSTATASALATIAASSTSH